MWELMKADFECNRGGYIFANSVFLIPIVINSLSGNGEKGLALLLLCLMWGGAFASSAAQKTRKIRFMAALPVSARLMGMSRNAMGIAQTLLMILLMGVSALISQRGHLGMDYLWWLLTKAGSIFMFMAFGSLSVDLFFCVNNNKWRRRGMLYLVGPLFILLSIFSGSFLFAFTILGPADFRGWLLPSISEFFLTFTGAFGLFLLGLALIAVDAYVYDRRASYTEQSVY
jgi:hypothetical protein